MISWETMPGLLQGSVIRIDNEVETVGSFVSVHRVLYPLFRLRLG